MQRYVEPFCKITKVTVNLKCYGLSEIVNGNIFKEILLAHSAVWMVILSTLVSKFD